MKVQFLSDGSEYRSYGGGNFSKKKGDSGLFWWTIGITMLLAMATASWFFSILVFAHPEKAFNYNLLVKFNKLEGIRKYSKLTVPHGKYYTGSKLLDEYHYFTPEQFRVHNDTLKRHYIRNFKEKNPVYVSGNFEVTGVRKLGPSDVFQSGWVALARDVELDDVELEVILPGLPSDKAPYEVGSKIAIDTTSTKTTYANLIHIQRMEGQKLRASVIPLVYECNMGEEGKAVVDFDPPAKLNMAGTWPIAGQFEVAAANKGVEETRVAVQTAQ
ncbi:MAG: hypothetical protein JNJ83_21860 [Verrucomicrobiaceae bacterium]|nr:hypothetical protein [Verrucomicrobiaceae bacterium]